MLILWAYTTHYKVTLHVSIVVIFLLEKRFTISECDGMLDQSLHNRIFSIQNNGVSETK